jgi:bifunctional DNase/RNase
MNRVEVKIEILSYAKSQVGSYVIVLADTANNSRKLPIIIKANEAQFIAQKLEGIQSPRPLTQDLFKTLTDGYNIDIQEIFIYNVAEGIFYAKMLTASMMEDNLNIECTVGDALSMAVLYDCPIYVAEDVMTSTSVDMTAPTQVKAPVKVSLKKPPAKKKDSPESIEFLDKLLNKALEAEDYETAVELRDKIAKLKKD